MTEIAIRDHEYRIGRLTPRQQLHLARRLLPIMVAAGGSTEVQGAEVETAGDGAEAAGRTVDEAAFADRLAKMSDGEVDSIVDLCLSVVGRKVTQNAYAPMITGGQMMYQDTSLPELLQLVWAVVEENVMGFFGGDLQGGTAPLLKVVRS